jgi:hypothetical protein
MKEIRNYIKEQFKIALPTCKEWDEGSYKDIPAAKLDDTYRLSFGEFSSTTQPGHIVDQVPVQLRLFRRLKGKSNHDSCVELLARVRSAIIRPAHYAQGIISNISTSGMSVSEMGENQDITEMRLDLTFTINHSY